MNLHGTEHKRKTVVINCLYHLDQGSQNLQGTTRGGLQKSSGGKNATLSRDQFVHTLRGGYFVQIHMTSCVRIHTICVNPSDG